jgi:hypothetical protein
MVIVVVVVVGEITARIQATPVENWTKSCHSNDAA